MARSFSCRDMEKALKNGEHELQEVLLRHAEECPACAAKMHSWNEISAAARTLHKTWDSPHLWPRIGRAITEATSLDTQAPSRKFQLSGGSWNRTFAASWRPVLAGIFLLVFGFGGTWFLLSRSQLGGGNEKRLLTERTLKEIEAAEQAYMLSIEKLSKLSPSQAMHAESPLLASYHEKLLIIDAAISECRNNIEINRFNAHLRTELLSMYREKQNTLQELLKEENHARN
jgi:hypothetical protein